MLGHRGCRLGITYPEIYGMQVRAIMEAACIVREQGVQVAPEIMIPLTGTVGEMKLTYENTKKVADGVLAEMGVPVKYLIGTMIELPRAALIADQIAETAEFFSFGTNDLTQMTFGYSRDDVAKFLPDYLQKGILPHDPFSVLDQEGVGELIKIGIERGRRVRHDLKVGIFGLPGGAVLPIYDALYDFEGLRHILVRQEAAAGHAAEGYARTSGRVGVCLVTSGPAATNLVTALQDAMMDSIPIVAFTGQVP